MSRVKIQKILKSPWMVVSAYSPGAKATEKCQHSLPST